MLARPLATLALWLAAALPAGAQAIDTAARSAILVDLSSDAVLMAKNPDEPLPPASMSKLMTVLMVFEALESGKLAEDDTFLVSEKAWRKGGSKMFTKIGDRIPVADLLRGVIVQSGNDASIVLAEGLAGSEEAFATRMTKRARELGMETASFRNATGWPDPEHRISVRDLAILAKTIVEQHPERYALFSERAFAWEGVEQSNRNPLLRVADLGADGLKTGHTEEAGYGMVASAEQEGRRLVLVVAGLDSSRARAQEAERILRWGFRAFETTELLAPGAVVGEAPVWVGEAESVPLMVEDALRITTAFGEGEAAKGELRFDGPLAAPIAKGDEVGVLRISAPGIEPVDVPVVAGADVARGGFGVKLKAAAGHYLDRGLAAMMGGGDAEPAAE